MGGYLNVSRFFFGVLMPDDVIGQAKDLVSCPLSHLSESFGLSLVFERVRWEINSYYRKVSYYYCHWKGKRRGVEVEPYLLGERQP